MKFIYIVANNQLTNWKLEKLKIRRKGKRERVTISIKGTERETEKYKNMKKWERNYYSR